MHGSGRFLGVTTLALLGTALMFSTPPTAAAQGEEMLYLVEFKATEAGAPTSPEQAIELLENLIIPSLDKLAKEGKVRAGGLLVGARAGVVVVAAKSHDEVTQLVRALPAWGVWHWQVTPLESFAHRVDLEKEMVQELRTQTQ